MKIVLSVAALVMAVCGVLMVFDIGKSNVLMGIAIIALGLGLAGNAIVKSKQ
mgnify:CR=1 FL=1